MSAAGARPADQPPAIARDLAAAVDGEVRFDRLTRAMYSTDASVYEIAPLGVVLPRSADDVVRTVTIAGRHGTSITARGGGTSQAGQAIGAGLILDTSKYLNRLLEVNVDERWARVEPGLVLDDLNARLRPAGLRFAPDLSSASRATIGGMMANNSSGARSVVYGKTIDHVLEQHVVLADGRLGHFRPVPRRDLAAAAAGDSVEARAYRVVPALASAHADEIARRFPKVLRRVGGYNLDEFVDAACPVNLTRIMVGSEGTLGIVVEAKVALVPLPAARVMLAIEFDDLLDALAATPVVLRHRPAAVEVMDRFILDHTRESPALDALRQSILSTHAGALLCVELAGEHADELAGRLDAVERDLAAQAWRCRWRRAIDAAAQARIWSLREAALGLSMAMKGDAKTLSFVEDTAVAPERLRDYIERFLAIVRRHGSVAGVYAHASVGCLHVRPVVDLKTADGVARFEAIAHDIADLVLEFGGALSGEHGDGIVRGAFTRKMFGPVLYEAFRDVKRAFDPDGLFNPGKIVDAPPLTANLRYGAGYRTPEPVTFFDYADHGGMGRAVEMCSGVGACRKRLEGTMCPSYRATLDEQHSTRGRANVLRLAMTGRLGEAGLGDRGRARRPRPVPRVPRVQGRVSGGRRRRALQERVPRRPSPPPRHAAQGARVRPRPHRRALVEPAGAALDGAGRDRARPSPRRGAARRRPAAAVAALDATDAHPPPAPACGGGRCPRPGDSALCRHLHAVRDPGDRRRGGGGARGRGHDCPGGAVSLLRTAADLRRGCWPRRGVWRRSPPTACTTPPGAESRSCFSSRAASPPCARTPRRCSVAPPRSGHARSAGPRCCSRSSSRANAPPAGCVCRYDPVPRPWRCTCTAISGRWGWPPRRGRCWRAFPAPQSSTSTPGVAAWRDRSGTRATITRSLAPSAS